MLLLQWTDRAYQTESVEILNGDPKCAEQNPTRKRGASINQRRRVFCSVLLCDPKRKAASEAQTLLLHDEREF